MPTKSAAPREPAAKRTTSPKRARRPRKPTHAEIAKRAYYIHLKEGRDDGLENWLRAEHELTAA